MLRVCVLGEQTLVEDRTAAVRIRSSRAVALIGYLAAHADSPQPRQRIAGLFWPESADAQALTNLRRELHNLRQVLGEEPSLVVTARDLGWRDTGTCRVDLRVYEEERLAALAADEAGDTAAILDHGSRALTAYRGEFLPGSYDDWLLEIRADLERGCADLCDLVAAARAQAGDVAGAVLAARRRIQLQPLEEVGYRALMRLQADLGDRAGALSTYHHCASVLERDLGVEPDPATRDLLARLMAAATAPGDEGARDPEPEPPRSGASSAELIGRSRELAFLRDRWLEAADGRPALVLVRGGAGVGKSRLVSEIAGLARARGCGVAITRCFATRGRLALAPVADWLRSPALRPSIAALEPGWRAEVDRLVPSQPDQAAPAQGARALADGWQRHRFFEGLARALIGADRPMLLILDDLQWCDHETLAFLEFCLRLDPAARLLVCATLRDDGTNGDGEPTDWIAGMRASGDLADVRVQPLEPADTLRLAEEISGRTLADADAELLHATTGGFPLYIVEAMRAGPELGPQPVGDLTAVLTSRLDQVSAPAHEVACLAAAVGTDFTLDLLAEASDLDADVVVRGVDELWRRRILRESGDSYDFSHDLLRDAAYAQVSPPRRWLLHRRIAQGLELLHPDGTDGVAAQLAEQYARGGRPDRAVAFYARAAEVASGVFAHSEAIRLYKQALAALADLPPSRDRDSRELAILEAIAGPMNARYGYASRELEQMLTRAIELAELLGRRNAILTGLAALLATQYVQGRTADTYRTGMRVMELAEPGSELVGYAHFGVGGAALSMGRPAEGLRHLELAAQESAGHELLSIGTRLDVHSTAWLSHAHWLLGHDAEASAATRAALAIGRADDHPYSMAIALAYAAVSCQFRGDPEELERTVAELSGLCARFGFAYYREWSLILDGWVRGADGLPQVREGILKLREQGSLARMPYWLSLLADVLARAGEPDSARATLDAALVTGRSHDDLWWLPEVLRMRAAFEPGKKAMLGRLREAADLAAAHGSVALLRRCEADLAAAGVRPPA